MEVAKLILEYLRVLLSWPVIALIIVAVVLKKFRVQLTALIDRVARIKGPGGFEFLMTGQADQNAADQTLRRSDGGAEPSAESGTAGDGGALASEKERAALWEYRYLNYYLVPRTQWVLEWLATRLPISYATYDSWMLPTVADPVERGAIIGALQTHHLIDVTNNMITVTPKGREYLRWRGPLKDVVSAWVGTRLTPPAPAPEPGAPASLAPFFETTAAEDKADKG